ncbi:hypothetical protein [Paraburkholderia sp. BL25I1N1]|uniref:hypothetical protein n=1 Tax=Paraburkholderia sp. BL25I1N1 TaxID=1938804 RepID=UPI000D07D353|nr:hypothetical protein [Paraburkholderia sp. BL25I1N1]PRY03785.1 hypothetical protein B0G73_114106 [Paraburkholderia sp. BL25I1N1]
MSRSKRYKADAKKRDGSTFAAVPYVVLESQGYINLSAYARALLLEFCREFNGRNNGRLCCIWDQLRERGWNSPNTVTKAKAELIANGLLWESRKGAFPKRTAWYALTWRDLDVTEDLDASPAAFPRRAYLAVEPIARTKKTVGRKKAETPITLRVAKAA